MSYSNEAYRAGKNGEDWYHVVQKYGDGYAVKQAYESGKSANLYGGSNNSAGGEALGGGLGLIMFALVAFYMGVIIYSPLIAITIVLLYPILPSAPSANFGAHDIIYGILFLIVVYLLSCGFEYFRARMLEARRKHQNWKIYFTLIFFIRIIVPGLALYFFFYFKDRDKYSDTNPFTYPGAGASLVLAGIVIATLLWKVKILNADNRFFFTKWAFDKGIFSTMNLPEKEATSIAHSETVQIRIFYTFWATLTLIGGLLLNHMVQAVFPGPLFIFDFTVALIFSFCFVLAAWLAKILIDRVSIIYLQYNFRDKMSIRTVSLILMSFYPTLIIWPRPIRYEFSYVTIILIYLTILGIQIAWKIRKFQNKSLQVPSV